MTVDNLLDFGYTAGREHDDNTREKHVCCKISTDADTHFEISSPATGLDVYNGNGGVSGAATRDSGAAL